MNARKSLVFYLVLFLLTFNLNASNLNFSAVLLNGDYLAFAEKMPSPDGGLPAIYKHIKEYPKIAKAAGIQGKVYVLAFINESGGVDDVKVVKGIGGGCDEAACDAIKKSKFNPGSHKGQAVKVKMSLAIVFKIE